jgi:hypothetical protein
MKAKSCAESHWAPYKCYKGYCSCKYKLRVIGHLINVIRVTVVVSITSGVRIRNSTYSLVIYVHDSCNKCGPEHLKKKKNTNKQVLNNHNQVRTNNLEKKKLTSKS